MRTWVGSERTYQNPAAPTMSAPITARPISSRRSRVRNRSRIDSLLNLPFPQLMNPRPTLRFDMDGKRLHTQRSGKDQGGEAEPEGSYQLRTLPSVNYVTASGCFLGRAIS